MSLIVPALEKRIYQEEEDLALDEPIPAGLRIRKTQHATTLHLFVEAVTEFNLEQVDYKEKCEERIHRIASIGEITFCQVSHYCCCKLYKLHYVQIAKFVLPSFQFENCIQCFCVILKSNMSNYMHL